MIISQAHEPPAQNLSITLIYLTLSVTYTITVNQSNIDLPYTVSNLYYHR